MTTALTVRGVATASLTLSTANKAVTTTGGTSNTTNRSVIGTSTGYGEIYAQGNSGAWAGGVGLGAVSGNGFIYDVTTLEGQQIIAGNWTPTLRLRTSTASVVADIYCRAYKYNANLMTYALIGTMSLTGQTINTTLGTFAFSVTSLAAANFGVSEKLYYDFSLNITTNNCVNSTDYVQINEGSASTGVTSLAQLVTPGYIVAPFVTKDLATRLRLLMGAKRDISTRLLLQFGTTVTKNIGLRLRLAIPPQLNLKTRLRVRATAQKDMAIRLVLRSSTGFFVPLITFTPNTLILPADVNTNFNSLNQATTFTGPITHLVSDGGQLTSTTAGGLLIGGQMGAVAYGDRIDVNSLPGSLILGSGITGSGNSTAGNSGSGFVLQIAGTTVGAVSADGFAGAGITADTTINFQVGSIVKTVSFLGRSNGVYNHGLGFGPDYAYAIHTVPTFRQCATSSPTSTTITVTANVTSSFICWVVEYN